jgi:glutamate racemase
LTLSSPPGPIGVFDSGVGGLTVLRALRGVLPAENFIYLGDTARLPYGTKSAATVVRYSLQCADALVQRGVRLLVVACNTASASALEALRRHHRGMAVIGVIEPGAGAAGISGTVTWLATDGAARFARVGSAFLGEILHSEAIEIIDL